MEGKWKCEEMRTNLGPEVELNQVPGVDAF